MSNKMVVMRLPKNILDQLEEIRVEMSKRLSCVDMDRSRVIRLTMGRGIKIIKEELGINSKSEENK